MHVLARTSVYGSTFGATVTGVLLSVLTQWGLFRYYWIIVKEGLTLLCIVLGPFGFYYWTLKAVTLVSAEGMGVLKQQAFIVNREQLSIGIVMQLASIVAMFLISVFKPWGPRKTGVRYTKEE
jgi:hypothetical protein